MSSHRLEKVQKELQLIVGQYLIHGFRGELHGLVSVTRVVAAGDLRTAKVYLSHLGSEIDAKLSLESIRAQRGEIQREVSKKLPMKFVPKLEFYWDEAFYLALKVDQSLRDLKEDQSDS